MTFHYSDFQDQEPDPDQLQPTHAPEKKIRSASDTTHYHVSSEACKDYWDHYYTPAMKEEPLSGHHQPMVVPQRTQQWLW
jgi:hypothetical protein